MRRSMILTWLLLAAGSLSAQAPPRSAPIPARPPFADSLPSAADSAIRLTITDAEAEGARWVRRGEPTFQPAGHGAEHWAEPVRRACVPASTARSGEFLIGGDGGAIGAHHETKIWWEPMHPAQSFSLIVRGVSLESTRDTLRYVNTGWAIGGSPRRARWGRSSTRRESRSLPAGGGW